MGEEEEEEQRQPALLMNRADHMTVLWFHVADYAFDNPQDYPDSKLGCTRVMVSVIPWIVGEISARPIGNYAGIGKYPWAVERDRKQPGGPIHDSCQYIYRDSFALLHTE